MKAISIPEKKAESRRVARMSRRGIISGNTGTVFSKAQLPAKEKHEEGKNKKKIKEQAFPDPFMKAAVEGCGQ
jgi:hypothetical protein